nr:flagellar biosynthetic protein FliO [Rhodospirillales bacterium]
MKTDKGITSSFPVTCSRAWWASVCDGVAAVVISVVHGSVFFLMSCSVVFAADNERKEMMQTVSYAQVLNWALGLVVVLSLFFACVWVMRKMGGFASPSQKKINIISGLSLGAREKLVLVQVGKKQLLLAVMPGKIDKLLVWDIDESLFKEDVENDSNNEFSQQLTKIMKVSAHE